MVFVMKRLWYNNVVIITVNAKRLWYNGNVVGRALIPARMFLRLPDGKEETTTE